MLKRPSLFIIFLSLSFLGRWAAAAPYVPGYQLPHHYPSAIPCILLPDGCPDPDPVETPEPTPAPSPSPSPSPTPEGVITDLDGNGDPTNQNPNQGANPNGANNPNGFADTVHLGSSGCALQALAEGSSGLTFFLIGLGLAGFGLRVRRR